MTVQYNNKFNTDAIRPPQNDDDKVYPCSDCGKLRSKNQGGTTFTVCDSCWDKHYKENHAD